MRGKGCDPTGVPTEPEELRVVHNLVEQERGLEYALQRCVTNNPQSLLLQNKCKEGAGRGYTSPSGPIQLARDEITAYCMMYGAQAAAQPEYDPSTVDTTYDPGYQATTDQDTAPVTTQAGMSGTTKMALVAGGLVLVLGAGYMFTRKKR
jgi:LPXTG-motif cell wall-anchored protein